jgi:hypothetical protein
MPYSSRFAPCGVDVRFSGVVTGHELWTAVADGAAHPYPAGRRFVLHDCTDVTQFNLTSAEVRAVAELPTPTGPDGTPVAVALVVPTPEATGLARMWGIFRELAVGRPPHTLFAHSREEALAWLAGEGIPAEDLAAIADG